MDFSITEEQSMLADSVSRFIDQDYDFERRMSIAESDDWFSDDVWQAFADLGLTAALFSEEDGGLGGGPVELMLIMEQFGRGLVVEPFLANVVLAGGVLKRAGSEKQKAELLAGIMAGTTQAALAFAEPQGRFDAADIATIATPDGAGYRLSGRKALVLNGGAADFLIVPARTSGEQADVDGITLFVVPSDAKGLTRKAYKTVDAHSAAEIELRDVLVEKSSVIGEVGRAYPVLSDALDDATLAIAAEAVGIMRTLHDKTVEYSRNRIQFGVPIGSFQALQHRMVDMLMECEQTRSLLMWAVMLADGSDADRQKAISAIKYQVGTAGRHVGEEAVQLHGGMGVTWELDVAHYFKRLTSIGILFGNADYHLDRYVALS
ncbi:MAG: acyl-CoA dehydrogenase family protein [Gammaproteobacteria bacterium]|nr:acyl-CoA dehydrogenase family protein [Gammaproteobacteria bacterium]MDH4253023.1 acyl-CoA dehydrogenase family protein [Gammaproteobacteria bacterium]MDH5308555.1 acyl-CoA dehydrogenase family protein [Gammaproteobacteria bacterium]